MFLSIFIIFILTINYTQQYRLAITCTRMSLNLTEDMHVIKYAQNYNFNETVTMSCISDFIGPTVTSQCTDVNNWSHIPPICTRIPCTRGSLNLNEHIHIMPNAQSYDLQVYVTMSCKRGFTGTNVSAQCIDVDKWSQPSPICKGITCTRGSLNLNEHIHIMPDAQSYDFQVYVTMSCKRGFTGTNVSAQCIDVDKWSQPSPICKGITCTRGSLNLNEHIHIMPDAQSYDFQVYVTMSCKRGFTGTNVSAQCIDVDKWSQPSPICKGITCTRWSLNLNAHNDVMKDAQSYDFQEYVTMSCKRGFTGTNVSAQCIDVDKWSQPSPICKGITCTNTSLQLSHHDTVGNDKQTYEFQEKVTMSCNYGFSGNNLTAQCTDVDKWSENSPICTEIVCDQISLNLNQSVTSINKGKSSYDFLENVTVSCKPGFKGQSTTTKCTDVNKWSGTTPICTRITCTNTSLQSSYKVTVRNDKQDYQFKEEVTMSCNYGFSGKPVTVRCTDVNKWSANTPTCRRITCKPLSLNFTQHAIITKEQKQSYEFQEIVTFSCKPGFTGGSMTTQCTDVDKWSPNIPICTEEYTEYKGVSYMVFGVVVALIIVVAVGIIICLMCLLRIKLKDSSKQYEDIKINMDQHRHQNDDQIYSELSDTQQ